MAGPTTKKAETRTAQDFTWEIAFGLAQDLSANWTQFVDPALVLPKAGAAAQRLSTEERARYLSGSPTKTPAHGFFWREFLPWSVGDTLNLPLWRVNRRLCKYTMASDVMRFLQLANCLTDTSYRGRKPAKNGRRPSKQAWHKAAREQAAKQNLN